ncbi:MAG TPA: hypothetical protein RMH99_17505 [Sandaracinaceae bacterium LLY-WYZ-13_1]|nr:hypothetical protein [Sandaracinaceae bacterium LLY-WYZ-13_1]
MRGRGRWWLAALLACAPTGCDSDGDVDAGPGVDAGADRTDGGGTPACDFRAVDGIVVIEAESLPITEDWATGSHGDAAGGEYVEWTGSSHNNDTSNGRFEVSILVEEAGLYRLQVRNRVGMGDDATEHNDTWMQFPDAAAFYGIQGPSDAQDRVYPRPRCEDAGFISGIEAMDDVAEASCPEGTSRDGYFKVYSSGALDWKWSARTSDSDAHDIVVRFDAPGVYTYQLAARGSFHQLDRIVIHRIELEDSEVRDLALEETSCR